MFVDAVGLICLYIKIKSEGHALTHHLDGKKNRLSCLVDSSKLNGMYFSDMVVIIIIL